MSSLRRSARPSGAPHRNLHADDGVSIVEMLIASFVLGLGVMGVATLLVAGARTASIAEAQRDATAVTSGELEILRSLDYDTVGIDPSAKGYAPEVDGLPTVTEIGKNLVDPLGEVTVDGVVFNIERSVTWAKLGSDARAYKIVVVEVIWDTQSGQRSLTMQTGLHEGLTGV